MASSEAGRSAAAAAAEVEVEVESARTGSTAAAAAGEMTLPVSDGGGNTGCRSGDAGGELKSGSSRLGFDVRVRLGSHDFRSDMVSGSDGIKVSRSKGDKLTDLDLGNRYQQRCYTPALHPHSCRFPRMNRERKIELLVGVE
jgi:hypothetical protein